MKHGVNSAKFDVEEELKSCNTFKDFDKRLSCKSEVLYRVTELQDRVNLNIMRDFRESNPHCSEDKRWLPVHMVDNANAVILGISRNKFNPRRFIREGYVDEKIQALYNKYLRVKYENEG